MDANQFFPGDSEHVERIVFAQIGFGREREFGEVGKRPEIGGMHAGFVKNFLVVRDVVVSVLQRPGEAFRLQRHDLVARGALDVVHLGAITTSPGLEFCYPHGAFP